LPVGTVGDASRGGRPFRCGRLSVTALGGASPAVCP